MDLSDLAMILSTIQVDPTEDEFQHAVTDASGLMMKVDDEQKLCLYGLYKQSTEGNAPNAPLSDNLIEKHKWYTLIIKLVFYVTYILVFKQESVEHLPKLSPNGCTEGIYLYYSGN